MKHKSVLYPDFLYEFTFAEKLRMRRNSLKLSQREVAKRSGISHGYYAQMELGKALLKDRTKLRALADTLRAPYEALLKEVEILSRDFSDLIRYYPNTLQLLRLAINSMSTIERIRSIDHIERTIPYSTEDQTKLAENIRLLLLGQLGLNDTPENGLRPLAHYVMPLSQQAVEWYSKNL